MTTIKTYWWTGRPNFGDRLAPLLLERFSSITPEWSPISDAHLLTLGSVLDTPFIRSDGHLLVLGSGMLGLRPPPPALYLGVRGPETAKKLWDLGCPAPVCGDPALLADELVQVKTRIHNLGILPHWSDTELEHRPEFLKYDPFVIDPTWPPHIVVEAIGSCRKLVTSSLHGLIVADSYGIPRRTEVAPHLEKREGGMFKFRDYNASIKLEFKIGVTQRASRQEVETLQHLIFDLYEGLEDRIHAL